MIKTLLAFFSRADENYFGGSMQYIEVGNTEVIAGKIKGRISTDIFKIEMKTPYAKDYNTCIEEAKAHKNSDARPELISMPENIDVYDTTQITGEQCRWLFLHSLIHLILQERQFFLSVQMKEVAWGSVKLILRSFVLEQM